MEQLIINLGTSPDSSTGDTINEAFNKVNENFTFLFTQYSSPNNFNSSYISLTPSPEEFINGVTDFGLMVNLPNDKYVTIMYDSALPRLDPVTNTVQYGAFRVQDNTDNLIGIYTNSIRTYGNQNLNLLSTGTGIVTVTGTLNYEQQVFRYIDGNIERTTVLDPDALVNARALVDYVSSFNSANDRIVSATDPTTYVLASDSPTKNVTVVIDNTQVAEFTADGLQVGQVLISDNVISTPTATNLVLQPGVGGHVSASSTRITNVADPVDLQDAVTLQYAVSNFLTTDVLNPDLTDLQDGSVLVYNSLTSRFEATLKLIKQEIDAGVY